MAEVITAPSKAWVGTDWDRDAATVVFADTRGKARALAAGELDCEFTEVDLRRSKFFDGMTEEELTPKLLMSNGFTYHCDHHGCWRKCWFDETTFGPHDEPYCDPACRDEAAITRMSRYP